MSSAGDKPDRGQHPPNKMTREEAERLRDLLRYGKPADLHDRPVLQRIGKAIAQAVHGPSKRDW
jgi:hypothetical protein